MAEDTDTPAGGATARKALLAQQLLQRLQSLPAPPGALPSGRLEHTVRRLGIGELQIALHHAQSTPAPHPWAFVETLWPFPFHRPFQDAYQDKLKEADMKALLIEEIQLRAGILEPRAAAQLWGLRIDTVHQALLFIHAHPPLLPLDLAAFLETLRQLDPEITYQDFAAVYHDAAYLNCTPPSCDTARLAHEILGILEQRTGYTPSSSLIELTRRMGAATLHAARSFLDSTPERVYASSFLATLRAIQSSHELAQPCDFGDQYWRITREMELGLHRPKPPSASLSETLQGLGRIRTRR